MPVTAPLTATVAVALAPLSAVPTVSLIATAGADSYPWPPEVMSMRAMPMVAVAINDTVGTADKGASATATVAVRGAVTGITVVQYRMKFHQALPPTLLRGYVQLSTAVVPGNQVPLSNANLNSASVTPITEYTGVDNPHYLGPTVVATKDRPVRILFRNLLPTGTGGDLFLPVDTSIMGSGPGPDMMTLDTNNVPMDMAADAGSVTDGVRNPMCGETPKPVDPITGEGTCFSENRWSVHLHGGIT